ncbi:nucleic acid-binding protein [Annulohypoxylon maeteangense]|uniref:nucleic acid-binding protein n=1 Tax=Annulohypoxylon maeteangense TaxID=1927788 RepID=UPI0020088F53|nr:nucleic acid-binding protein [Annulohypoxylon maeteangense]KAI0887138.1 nucleic acid-binding protein [Annulohypoxylon maeteangense]
MSFLARRFTAAAPSLARSFSASARRDVAKITLVGNLAATPEVKATSTGHDVIEYAVASNSGSRDNRQTSWFRVAAFIEEGPRRDFLTSLPKGATVYVEGDAIMNTYNDAEGKARSSLSIYQRNLEVLRRPAPATE